MFVLPPIVRKLIWVSLVCPLAACSCDDDGRGIVSDGGSDGQTLRDARMDGQLPPMEAGTDARITQDGSAPDSAVDGALVDGAVADSSLPDASLPDAMLEAGAPDAMIPDPIEPCTSSAEFDVITVGSNHVCAIRSDDALFCWGRDDHGQLGDGTAGGGRHQAQQVGSNKDWIEVDAGVDYTCGIRAAGELYCWGHDQYGRLGDGAATGGDVATPSRVGDQSGWSNLSVGSFNACAIRGGDTYCWGHGASGRLGNGDTMDENAPSLVGDTFSLVSTGGGHSCGVLSADAKGQCWGSNSSGVLGTGSDTPSSSSTPLNIAGSTTWTSISTGSFHACGVSEADELYCWGSNGVGQLGTGSKAAKNAPTQVGTDTDWDMVSAGSLHSCAIKTGGALYCWGSNGQGQLGTGGGPATAPVLVQGLSFAQVDAHGSATTCGITTSGFVYCWGDNSNGQLGLVRADAIRPVRVCP